MTRDEQINTLEEILLLEATAIQLSSDIDKVQKEKFKPAPKSPEKPKLVSPIYPLETFTPIKIGAITAAVLVGVFLVGVIFSAYDMWVAPVVAVIVLGILITVYMSKHKEYLAECASAEEACKVKNDELETEYKATMQGYHEITRRYRDEKIAWEENRQARYNQLADDYNATINSIENLYNTTKIVPVQYRSVEVISYLYDYMSSSDADIQQGLTSYDSHVQHELTQSHIREQQISNVLADERNQIAQKQTELSMEQNRLAYEQNLIAVRQNELSEEGNEIARKARRDANIAAAIATIQRHNTNKKLDKMNKKRLL